MSSAAIDGRVKLRDMQDFPDDVLQLLFSYLSFRDKVAAGMVCKRWDQCLRGKLIGRNHWDVQYNLDSVSSAPTSASTPPQTSSLQSLSRIGR